MAKIYSGEICSPKGHKAQARHSRYRKWRLAGTETENYIFQKDGNGRIARTLFYYKAIKNDLKFLELLSVSANLKVHGKRYERSFDQVIENELDITYFIDFCLDSLIHSINKVEDKVNYLIDISCLQEKHKLSSNQISLLQRMALHRYVSTSIEAYSKEIDKSREIARRELKKLLSLNFLIEKKVGRKFEYFINTSILKESVIAELQSKN